MRNGCDLVNYEVAPGRTSSSAKLGIRRSFGELRLGFGCERVRPRRLRGCRCLEVVVLEYKRSMRKALPVAGLGNCSFGVQTQYAEDSSSGRPGKLLFWSTNVVRGMLFQWLGWETALLEYKLSTRNALLVAGP